VAAAGHELHDFVNDVYDADDDYSDFAVPLLGPCHAEMWYPTFFFAEALSQVLEKVA